MAAGHNRNTHPEAIDRPKQRASNRNRMDTSIPIPHLHRETLVGTPSQATYAHERHISIRETHIYTSTDCRSHPLNNLRCAPARRQRARPTHTTFARVYQTELDSLPPYRRPHHSAPIYKPFTLTQH